MSTNTVERFTFKGCPMAWNTELPVDTGPLEGVDEFAELLRLSRKERTCDETKRMRELLSRVRENV